MVLMSDGGLLLTVVDTRPGFGIGIDNEAGVLTRCRICHLKAASTRGSDDSNG